LCRLNRLFGRAFPGVPALFTERRKDRATSVFFFGFDFIITKQVSRYAVRFISIPGIIRRVKPVNSRSYSACSSGVITSIFSVVGRVLSTSFR